MFRSLHGGGCECSTFRGGWWLQLRLGRVVAATAVGAGSLLLLMAASATTIHAADDKCAYCRVWWLVRLRLPVLGLRLLQLAAGMRLRLRLQWLQLLATATYATAMGSCSYFYYISNK